MTERTVFYKEAFAKTSAQRRQRILEEAVRDFAVNGYAGTNINLIAQRAGISIGAMYSYFASKEDLFLTIVSHQFDLLMDTLDSIDDDRPFDEVVRELFRLVMVKTHDFPEFSQIYQHVTTQSMSAMAKKLSNQFEADMVAFLLQLIEQGKRRGELSRDLDARMLAFTIDNLLIMFQFSFSSDYYRERMKLFLGEDEVADGAQLMDRMMAFIRQQDRPEA